MDCRIVRNSLSDYLDGALPVSEAVVLDGHLNECSPCQALKLDFAEIRLAATELPVHTPPRALWARIQLEIEAGETAAPQKSKAASGGVAAWWQNLKARDFTFNLPQLAGVGALATVLLAVSLYGAYQQGLGNRGGASAHNGSALTASVIPEESSLQAQIKALETEITPRKASWDPSLLTLFNKQLGRIQSRREECRQKLVTAPSSAEHQEHQQMMRDLYREEIELLETFARMK